MQKAYLYIRMESLQNAVMVRDDIIDMTIALAKYPTKYAPDKYKANNDGTWRAFEKHSFRVSYRIMPNEIRVVRLRHTSRSPLMF